jgi:hypothetical protein
MVTLKTRLAVVTNLHNPSGARIPPAALQAMARILAEVGAWLLVDEVYLECLFSPAAQSSVHAGANVLTTNSLTKAYGLDGLRAGWVLGPAPLIRRAGRIHDLLGVNGVAPGEHLTLLTFRRLRPIRRRADGILDAGLRCVEAYFAEERRLRAVLPPGGNVVFPKLPPGLDGDTLASHLRARYSTLVVPGRFFEAKGYIRLSFGCRPDRLARGLVNVSRALDGLLGT